MSGKVLHLTEEQILHLTEEQILSIFFDSIDNKYFIENPYILEVLRDNSPTKLKKIIDGKNKEGDTLLLVLSKKDSDMVASNKNFNDFFDLLLHFGADVNVKDESGKTALYYARENGNDKMVDILLKNGATDDKEGGKKSKKSKKKKYRKSKKNKRKTIRKRRK